MSDRFTDLQAALKARLVLAFPETHWRYRVVMDPMTPREFDALIADTPMIAIAWKGFRQSGQGRQVTGEAKLSILIIIRNVAGSEARFLGDALGPGLYPAVAIALQHLHGATLGPAGDQIGTMQVAEANAAFGENPEMEALAMARLDVSIGLALGNVPADEFLRFTASFSAPPFPNAALPQDTVTVRTP